MATDNDQDERVDSNAEQFEEAEKPDEEQQRYNKFFKHCMSDLSLAKEMIRDTLPQVCERYDLDSLMLASVEHSDAPDQALRSSIVYKIKKS